MLSTTNIFRHCKHVCPRLHREQFVHLCLPRLFLAPSDTALSAPLPPIVVDVQVQQNKSTLTPLFEED